MNNRPLILDFKLSREDEQVVLQYEYDGIESLNMIETVNGRIPFIDIQQSDIEFTTKTRVHQEQDDDSYLFSLYTETKVKNERDDYHPSIEMVTKTLASQERDDEHFNNYE